MGSEQNNGILVDAAVQTEANAQFTFQNLSSIKAKGYLNPVPTFQPFQMKTSTQRIHTPLYVERTAQSSQILEIAEDVLSRKEALTSETVFLYGERGAGKSTFLQEVGEKIQECSTARNKHLICCRSYISGKDKIVPLR